MGGPGERDHPKSPAIIPEAAWVPQPLPPAVFPIKSSKYRAEGAGDWEVQANWREPTQFTSLLSCLNYLSAKLVKWIWDINYHLVGCTFKSWSSSFSIPITFLYYSKQSTQSCIATTSLFLYWAIFVWFSVSFKLFFRFSDFFCLFIQTDPLWPNAISLWLLSETF